MNANVGSFDRIVRFVIGLALIILPFSSNLDFWNNPAGKYGSLIVGVVLVATAFLRFCPLYRIFGLQTCKPA